MEMKLGCDGRRVGAEFHLQELMEVNLGCDGKWADALVANREF